MPGNSGHLGAVSGGGTNSRGKAREPVQAPRTQKVPLYGKNWDLKGHKSAQPIRPGTK